jgi:hypothetical protein
VLRLSTLIAFGPRPSHAWTLPGVALLVVGGALGPGCSLDRSGVGGGTDQPPSELPDASSVDAQVDAGRDAQTIDSCVASSETCDGRDSDCDGRVDEGLDECGDCELVVRPEGGTYLFCDDELDYDDSREACRALGYDLVLVDDAMENEFLHRETSARDHEYRLGLDDRDAERTFVWVDGTVAWSEGRTLTYVNWLGGQPDDHVAIDDLDGEDCVIMRGDGKWNDDDCYADQYICESIDR